MTKVKICGITNKLETGFLNKYLPDYAGFVFAESRRRVTPEKAAELGAELAPTIKKVGVFLDHDVKLAADIAGSVGLDAVQLHGNEDREYIELLHSMLKQDIEIWKALKIEVEHFPDTGLMHHKDVDRLLLDTFVPGIHGGTGKYFDWRLVSKLDSSLPVILAGGLNPYNVRQAILQTFPYAVDISSGVESEGMKDEQKVKAFIEAVRG